LIIYLEIIGSLASDEKNGCALIPIKPATKRREARRLRQASAHLKLHEIIEQVSRRVDCRATIKLQTT
jgi:hypothetical protein